jgi:hypothetical protein
MNLNYWLRKTPQPVTILADDKRIDVPRNGRAWRDLTATIKALEPSKLTCLDGQGNVIRSVVLEEEASAEPAAPASPEMSDLQLFARLLAEGYEKGMTANQPIIDSAMGFVERQGVRLAKAESEIDRLRTIIHKQTLQIAELQHVPAPAASEEGGILGAIVTGAMQGLAASSQGIAAAPTPINAAAAGQKGVIKK